MGTKKILHPAAMALILILSTAGVQAQDSSSQSKSKMSNSTHYHWYDGATRRSATLLGQAADVAIESGADQVFKVGAQKMTLPGGVLVKFQGDFDAASIARWMQEQGFASYRAVISSHTWLIDTPSGMKSLTIANRLHEQAELVYAAPNWARQRRVR